LEQHLREARLIRRQARQDGGVGKALPQLVVVHVQGQADLVQVRGTVRAIGGVAAFCTAGSSKQSARDDADDHEQFDESKAGRRFTRMKRVMSSSEKCERYPALERQSSGGE